MLTKACCFKVESSVCCFSGRQRYGPEVSSWHRIWKPLNVSIIHMPDFCYKFKDDSKIYINKTKCYKRNHVLDMVLHIIWLQGESKTSHYLE